MRSIRRSCARSMRGPTSPAATWNARCRRCTRGSRESGAAAKDAAGMSLKCGIVGLPNVGKSTLFNALTAAGIAAENYPFCTIEPNVGIVEVPDPRLAALAAIAKPQKVHSGDGRVRRHRGPGRRRVERRGARQPVPGQHPRDRRDRPRRSLLRGSERRPRRRQGRSDRRRRDDRHRARARRSRDRRQADRQGREAGARAGGDKEAQRIARGAR